MSSSILLNVASVGLASILCLFYPGALGTFAGDDAAQISVGWSFWPCTDIDLAFGTVRPREPKTVSGRIWFLKERIDKVLNTVRIGAN